MLLEVRTDNAAAIALTLRKASPSGYSAPLLPAERRGRVHDGQAAMTREQRRHHRAGYRIVLRRDRCRPGADHRRCAGTARPRARVQPGRTRPVRGSGAGDRLPRAPGGDDGHRPRRLRRCRHRPTATSTPSRSRAARDWPVRCWSGSPRPRPTRRPGTCRCTASTTSPATSRRTPSSTARCRHPRWRCWFRAGTPSCCGSTTWPATSPSSAAPSTTRPARPTTRWPGCWAWATPAAR